MSKILEKGGYKYHVVHDAVEAESAIDLALDNIPFGLAIIDTNVFSNTEAAGDLIDKMRDELHLPMIMTTEDQIDRHFDLINDFHINQVLNKPVKSKELLNVIHRLMNPRPELWFGLQNYIQDLKALKRIEITDSNQIRPCIAKVLEIVKDWGFDFDFTFEMDLVWQEMLTNAVYHSHGYSSYKRERIPIRLPEGYKVDVRFGHNGQQFGFSVRDYRGSLTPGRIVESLSQAVEQQNMIEKSLETGEDVTELVLDRGRGLDIIRRMTGEYYFIIDPDKSTEVMIIYDGSFENDDSYSSLKILELPAYH